MNVKPGDLAIVVDDGGKYENVGLVVSVISFEGTMDCYEFGEQAGRGCWVKRSLL